MPLKIRREYPSLYATASMWVATPLIALYVSFYIAEAVSQPASVLYSLGVTTLGATMALSAVCLTIPRSARGADSFHYAGEKFLHSSLLLVQSVMLVFVKESIGKSTFSPQHPALIHAGQAIVAGLFTLVSGGAAVCWYWAFDSANRQLWGNWRKKIEIINSEQEKHSIKALPKTSRHRVRS
jgi:hypothetical protein